MIDWVGKHIFSILAFAVITIVIVAITIALFSRGRLCEEGNIRLERHVVPAGKSAYNKTFTYDKKGECSP